MKVFDLKKFREKLGFNQEEFASKIGISQSTVSRMELNGKTVSDRLLDKISTGVNVDLEEYKSYNERSEEQGLQGGNHLAPTHEVTELEARYNSLKEEKSKIDERFFELSEKHNALESSLLTENNILLKKVIEQNETILSRLTELERR